MQSDKYIGINSGKLCRWIIFTTSKSNLPLHRKQDQPIWDAWANVFTPFQSLKSVK